MKPEYQAWIDEHVKTAYGMCAPVTLAMAEAFPELTRVRGHYYCVAWGERAHWWLVDEEGLVVDPTATQFPSNGRGTYVPWDESQPEPTGKCLNCGDYTYDSRDCCSEDCTLAITAYYRSF